MAVDYSIVIGQNLKNNEGSYQEEINNLAGWCTETNLQQTLTKPINGLLVFKKKESDTHLCLLSVELNSFRFLGVSATENVSSPPW